MKYITKRAGMIELWMVLPLFIGIAFFIGIIGFTLITQTRLEKKAWEIQTQTETPFRKTQTIHANGKIPQDKRYAYKLSSEVLIPGSPMNHSPTIKWIMWEKSMSNAGFDYSFAMLGYREVLDSGPLPLGKLGDLADVIKGVSND